MVPRWLDAELHNWAAWCRSGEPAGPRVQDRAASAEGRYIAPSDIDADPEPRPPRPNRERAEIVHRVYLFELDARERQALKLRYVRRWPDNRIQRIMRVSSDVADTILFCAARRVAAAFNDRGSDALRKRGY